MRPCRTRRECGRVLTPFGARAGATRDSCEVLDGATREQVELDRIAIAAKCGLPQPVLLSTLPRFDEAVVGGAGITRASCALGIGNVELDVGVTHVVGRVADWWGCHPLERLTTAPCNC